MKELVWDLADLFKSKEAFYNEIKIVQKQLEEIKIYESKEIDNDKVFLELLNKKWTMKELANNVLVYGSLMYYKNIQSEECITLKKEAEQLNEEVNRCLKFVDIKVIALGYEKVFSFVSQNAELEVYRLSLDNLFRMQSHIQEEGIYEKIKENNTIIHENLSLYNTLLRDIVYGEIEVDGETISLNSSNFGKYISSRDRETRRKTYITVNTAFKDKQEEFAQILNTIYQCRNTSSHLEEYDSVLDKVLFEENIDKKIIDTLIEVVHHNLPLIDRYLHTKAERLGIKEPHLYDFGVPLDDNLKIKYTLEEAIDIIINALQPLGEEYIEVVRHLLDGHIDAVLDENKHQSITFSWHTYSFMNFRGSYIDIKNMIHEIGHIVNYYLSHKKQPYIYEDSTIFVGETASIVNEILLNRYLYKQAKTNTEKIFYVSKEIENYFTSVFKQTMYTELENELYREEELTSTFLCNTYSKILKKYYGENVVYDDIAEVEWTRLGHLYRWSYYPYKYATGLLLASVVVRLLVDEHTISKEQYIDFLSSGSNSYSLDLLKLLHVDLTDLDIINHGFKELEEAIQNLEQLLEKNTIEENKKLKLL